jgi:hypothetical protein
LHAVKVFDIELVTLQAHRNWRMPTCHQNCLLKLHIQMSISDVHDSAPVFLNCHLLRFVCTFTCSTWSGMS